MKSWAQKSNIFLVLIMGLISPFGNTLSQAFISNGTSWYDTDGDVIQAHGSGLIKVGKVFYWFGTDKSANSNTFTTINCYASTDLVHWEFKNTVVTNATHKDIGNYVGNRVIERPKVVYNETTGKYVMWAHWDWSNYSEAEAVVFQCDKIDGDYELVKHFRPFNNMARDCGLYKLKDGTAYFFAAANQNADMVLYKLTDDYLDVKEQSATLWPGSWRESPVVFEKNNNFYFVTSGTTGWAPNQGKYSTAAAIEGPWSALSNFGNNTTYDSQPTYVFTIEGTEDTTYVYCGDRWQDPTLKDSKYIWLPIQFTPSGIKIDYMHRWRIDIEKGTWVEVKDSILSQDNWRMIYVDSEDNYGENFASNAFDGDGNTFWHTEWKNNQPPHPHEIQIDFGDTASVHGFSYLPRQDNNVNGTIAEYEFYTSLDNENWTDPVKRGEFLPGSSEKIIMLNDTVLCRYIRLLSLSEINGNKFTSIAELNVLGVYGEVEDLSAGVLKNAFDGVETIIYPNPFQGRTIHFKNNKQILHLSLIDLTGKTILNHSLSYGETSVSFNNYLLPGIYTLVLNYADGRFDRKQIIVI